MKRSNHRYNRAVAIKHLKWAQNRADNKCHFFFERDASIFESIKNEYHPTEKAIYYNPLQPYELLHEYVHLYTYGQNDTCLEEVISELVVKVERLERENNRLKTFGPR